MSTPLCLTPGPGHFMFGYYDRNPWDPTLRYHLALRIPQQDHLTLPDEEAEVGVIDLRDGNRWRPLARTRAWNFQQGAMTQWLRNEPGCFVFNDAVDEGGRRRYIARVFHVNKGEIRRLPRPVYILSPDCRTAATLEFGRIWYRPGYSYAGSHCPEAPKCPDDVGVWMMDLLGGEPRLVLSIRQLAAIHPNPDEIADTYLWLNHLGWNCDGTRLMVLFRHLYPEGTGRGWKTFLYTFNPDGSDPRCALPHPYWIGISHQLWGRTPREILVDANWRRIGSEFIVFNDGETTFHNVAPGVVGPACHASFSPDGRWILADTYAIPERHVQQLRLIDVASRKDRLLAECYHDPKQALEFRDLRCDLHARWRADGKAFSFDSIMSGERKVYMMDID